MATGAVPLPIWQHSGHHAVLQPQGLRVCKSEKIHLAPVGHPFQHVLLPSHWTQACTPLHIPHSQSQGRKHEQPYPAAHSAGVDVREEAQCALFTQELTRGDTRQHCQAKQTFFKIKSQMHPVLNGLQAIAGGNTQLFARPHHERHHQYYPGRIHPRKAHLQNFVTKFWLFLLFVLSISFMGPGAGCQHSELLAAPCNFCKCPMIKWWD